jgi:hypothetical protein
MERRGLGVDPDKFGIVESRYKPAWKTQGDTIVDENCYIAWREMHAGVEGARVALQVGEEGTTPAGSATVVSEEVDEAADKEAAKGEKDQEGVGGGGTEGNVHAGKQGDTVDSPSTTAQAGEPSVPKKRTLPQPVETTRTTIKISDIAALTGSASASGPPKTTSGDPTIAATRRTSANDNNTGSETHPQPKPPNPPALP